MKLRFAKMHGLGNDFMVIEGVHQTLDIEPEMIRRWSDRRTGIGFDQCLLVLPSSSPRADFDYRIFNADGSEAGQCGNGARCVARFIREEKLSNKSELQLKTRDRHLLCILREDGSVSVDMGRPEWLPVLPCEYPYHAVSMGNPHAVIRADHLGLFPLEEAASLIRRQSNFPDGVNVGVMEILSSSTIRLRVNERGAGETTACGTGACAAMVVGKQFFGLESAVTVQLTGGTLWIEWSGERDASVWMTGPAQMVYQGILQE